MTEDILKRYIWLIDLLQRRGKLTLKEISDLWDSSSLNDRHEKMNARTFHRDREKIDDIFNVSIQCDVRDGNVYYIDKSESLFGDHEYIDWLLDTFTTLNRLSLNGDLKKRVLFEKIPSGHKYLTDIVEAMRNNSVLEISYQSFGKKWKTTFPIEPYAMKLFRRRWYVIANSPLTEEIRIYALDRIQSLKVLDKKFKLPKDFDAYEYFDGFAGVIADKSVEVEKIVLKAHDYSAFYLESLPLHDSQKVVERGKDYITFEYYVRPTFDFVQNILDQAGQIEVLEPKSLQQEIVRYAKKLISYYKK